MGPRWARSEEEYEEVEEFSDFHFFEELDPKESGSLAFDELWAWWAKQEKHDHLKPKVLDALESKVR